MRHYSWEFLEKRALTPFKNTGNEGEWSMDSSTIEQLIRTGLPDAQVDVSGADGVHFEALVVSPSFVGLPTLRRHRLVYATLGSLMGQEIHALGLRTLTPAEQGGEAP
jgi:acid stress-induced BolA-like protein IbaG/YrbA